MKKHNGHSNGHHRVPPSTPPESPTHLHGELAEVEPGFAHGQDRPLTGRSPRDWETALAAVARSRHAMPSPVAKAVVVRPSATRRALAPTASQPATLSRILLQPTILKSVPIGDNGDVGIGLHARENGVIVQTEAWSPMQIGDVLELFWGVPSDPQSPDYPGIAAASKTLQFPEELNKPVLLTVPENDVVTGWFNVVCRVTRASTGFPEWSPLLRVLVKLDRPGGIDPAPDENPNLAAPILPPEVIQNGVDAAWAARGVPVIIQPYPNMALLDRIRLNWGGAFVEYTVRDGVNQPVTVTVDEATVRAAGDGDALVVRYQIFDVVGDRSGWSPSTEVVVSVQENALFLPEVTNADDNGVIDLAQLGGEDVRVLVTAFAPDFAIGDTVTLQWIGHTAEGLPVPYEEAQEVTRSPVQTLEFYVPNANVVALAQGDAVVSYSLQNGRSSKQVRVTIAGNAAALPAPSVDEASGGELDASESRATVRIPPYPTMDVGDVVTLIWSGVRADGQSHVYQATRQISGSAVGKEISLVVPTSEIALLAGGTVQVWYEVVAGDGTPLPPSQVLTLRVSDTQGVLLPAPSVDEAPDNATLDPDAVDLYAEVRILPYPGMAVDDRVDMYWTGSGAGGSMTDWITIRAATLNKPLLFDVDKAYVDANDGGTVTVRYTVMPKGGQQRSSTSLTLRVGQQLSAPAVKEADGGTYLDPQKVEDHLTVVVPIYGGALPTDEVRVKWAGTPGAGSYTTSAQLLDSSREVALPVTLVAYNLDASVQVTYDVLRNGVLFRSSEPLVLRVLPMSDSALLDSRPQILQAINVEDGSGVLDLDAVTGGATIRIHIWPHIAVGQTLWLRLHGKDIDDGSDHSLTVWQPPGSRVTQDWLTQGYYDATVPYSYFDDLMWGSTLSVEFKVGLDQSLDESAATAFPVRTYVIDDWKDSITTFDDGTAGNWERGPAYTQSYISGGFFTNMTSGSGQAGVVLKQNFYLTNGRRYKFSFKIRCWIESTGYSPNFSVSGPKLGEIIPA